MYLQPQTFNTRLLEHSTLSPCARLVAMVISGHRFKRRLKPHEPLSLTVAVIARDCGMSPRSTRGYIAECAGWIETREVHRDGHQQPNEYLLVDGTDAPAPVRPARRPLTEADLQRLTESKRMDSENPAPDCRPLQSEPAEADCNGSPIIGDGLQGVLRSKYNGGRAAAPPSAAAGAPNGQGKPESREPVVAAAAPVPAQPRAAGPDAALTRELERDVLIELERINAIRARGRNRLPRVPA